MASVTRVVRNRLGGGEIAELRERVASLEAEVQECRQLNIRLAELCDVVAELLVPMAERDEAATAAALDRFRAELGDPTR
ncbi:DUF6752 domain-containing protein [Nocardioides sp.]|uniref:DUF6752 domain-containing protein n=1 Tax=Nocardioides sp. TaxID=35761 RepID=UPI003518D9F6